MRRSTTRLIALVVLALLFASPVAVVAGQATPTPGRDSALLATAPFDVPPAPTPIVLARISFATGSGLSMNANPGPAMHFVESGGFEVLAGGPMTLYRTPEDISAISGEEVASGTTFTIGPGDLLVIPANSPFEVFNVQQEPAIALIVELFSRPEGTVFPDGIALELLVAGVADQLPPGPTHTFIRRDAFAPDVAFPQSPSGELGRAVVDGPTLVYVESGTLEYTIFSGEVQITRSAPTATPQPADGALSAPPSIDVTVAEGEAIFKQMSTEYILRNVGEEPAVVLALGFSDADVGPYATPGAGL